MTSGLWIATAGLPTPTLIDAVPPACRRRVDTLPCPGVDVDGPDVILQAPEWPVEAATHFVPSFAALTPMTYSVRLEVSVRAGGAWSPFAVGVGLGPTPFAPREPVEGLAADIDVFRTPRPVEAARLRVRLRGDEAAAVLAAPWMLTLSASDSAPAVSPGASTPAPRLEVPRRSQMEADSAIARRICSPTCVAMVMDFWGRSPALDSLAAEMFHPGVDLYGVWPAAIVAAGRHGLSGYLLRFPDWTAAAYCLGRGLPIVASVRYAAGELTGAAVAQTPGHLVVLTGWSNGEVLVNDPGAPDRPSVARRYRLDEIVRVWLERAAIGYVIFPVGGPDMAPHTPPTLGPPRQSRGAPR
jgi:Peptidase_C39 like family